MRFGTFVAALLLAAPAQSAILYQATLPSFGSTVYFDDFVSAASVVGAGSTWISITGGTLTSASWEVQGELQKFWWELIDEDDEGNQEIYLNGNEYGHYDGCTVTPGAPSCTSFGDVLSRLQNNVVRVDYVPPQSINLCYPFDGVFNADCAFIYNLYGAMFSIEAQGLADVTLTISDTRIAGAVPEPGSWMMLIAGFGLTGAALRRKASARAFAPSGT